jgi:hypothetical protein
MVGFFLSGLLDHLSQVGELPGSPAVEALQVDSGMEFEDILSYQMLADASLYS